MATSKQKSKHCSDCDRSNRYHVFTWLEEIIGLILPWSVLRYIPQKFEKSIEDVINRLFAYGHKAKLVENFDYNKIPLKTACFVEAAQKKGIKLKVWQSHGNYTSHWQMKIAQKVFSFDVLPAADFLNKGRNQIVNDKVQTKKLLVQGNFPVVASRAFWFWQKNRAKQIGQKISFPLVVKPRSGSASLHVTTNLLDPDELAKAVDWALAYSPAFIVEKYLSNVSVFRATVVDFDKVACIQQVAANVVGDGQLTLQQLIDKKNADPNRQRLHHSLKLDETAGSLIAQQDLVLTSIPKIGQQVYLQRDPFLRLGADLIEVTDKVHPANLELVKQVARYFDIRLVGIDLLMPDISLSWKEQNCSILELNNLPSIEVHHYPYRGLPQNVAGALADMVLRYYN